MKFGPCSRYFQAIFFIFALQVCLVLSDASCSASSSNPNAVSSCQGLPPSPSPSSSLTQIHNHQQNPQQQQHQQQLHAGAGSGGRNEPRNSYNLLSEAMSQAVSSEFSSGSACHPDDLECYNNSVQDRLGMEAIRTLHRQLDDDDNGNIDLSESDDFLREELKYDSGYEKRQKAFHFNDDMHISVKELWEAWLRSEVHNWTLEQTTDWLAQSVQLPQYVDLFRLHKVTGAALPRLAVNNMHYVGNVLGIKDPIHKQKIALKAMDVVLFGPPRETGTRWKDYILVTLLLSAIIGCWYAYQQNKNAKRHLRRMAQDMEGLQRAELSLQEMQKELERARMEQENVATEKEDLERRLKEAPLLRASSSDLEVQQLKKEIEILRSELSRAEFELVDNHWTPPPQLQSWLQYTYELENKNHLKKRINAEKQLQTAREACEKLRKKRSSLVGAFVSTHGKSIDDVDRSIVEARNSLGEVTNELQERLHRWKQIESCLGFNIVNNNGMPYLESVLYGRTGALSNVGSNKGSRGRITSSTDDLDDESVQGFMDGFSNRSGVGSGGGGGGGGASHTLNSIRDDSSGSDDGTDTQSVQFYLGNLPSSSSMTFDGGRHTMSKHQQLLPMLTHDFNNFINNSANVTSAANHLSAVVRSSAYGDIESYQKDLQAQASSSSSSPPLTKQSNSYPMIVENNAMHRNSPSTSSECSVSVPPRSKRSGTPTTNSAVTQPTAAAPPLPPPRRAANQSDILRSQSMDFVSREPPTPQLNAYILKQQQQHQQALQPDYKTRTNLTIQQQQQQQQQQFSNESGSGVTLGNLTATSGHNSLKKMVKQHSTTSQKSTSSTSSSVHSAPPTVPEIDNEIPVSKTAQSVKSTGTATTISPVRHAENNCNLLREQAIEAAIMSHMPAFSGSLQSLVPTTDRGIYVQNIKQQAPIYNTNAMESRSSPASDTISLDGSVKKRKRKIRFPFSSVRKSLQKDHD